MENDCEDVPLVLEEEAASTSYDVVQYTTMGDSYSTSFDEEDLQKITAIEEALMMNKKYEELLCKLNRLLQNRLVEVIQKLSNLNYKDNINDKESFEYKICGKPYFRDLSKNTPPDNEDTITMRNLGMYDFSQVTRPPGWTTKDKDLFRSEIQKMSQDLKMKELQTKMTELRRKKKESSNIIELNEQIKAVNNEIASVKYKSLSELALPIDQDYDWELLSNKLKKRHTADEYQSFWKLYIHPSINKEKWAMVEHVVLRKLLMEHKFLDWDKIAKEHNFGRSGYQCFMYFRFFMFKAHNGKKWTKKETEYLRSTINHYKLGDYIPWNSIAESMEGRTKIQIYNKYLRLNEDKKGRFLPEEDSVILNCVEEFGTNFKKMIPFLPGRSVIQIRTRYNVLSNTNVSTTWTNEEDKQLVHLTENQNNKVLFASLCKFFPGKSRENLRSRYLTLKKWLKKHPNGDLKDAPRRPARRLLHGQASDNLDQAVEDLKIKMHSDLNKAKSKTNPSLQVPIKHVASRRTSSRNKIKVEP